MYVQRNIEMPSCNHCCCGKTMIITQPVCPAVALCIQHTMSKRHVVICGLSRSVLFFHIIS